MLYQNVLILLGLLAIATSKKLNRDDVRAYDKFNIQDVQGLLKSIQEKGNEKHKHNNHKSHHEENQHDDDHNHIQPLNLVFKNNKRLKDLDNKNKVNKIMCALTGSYGCGRKDDRNDLQASNDVTHDKKNKLDNDMGFEVEAKNDIELLLNDLEKKLLTKKGSERDDRVKNVIRCSGNRCELLIDDRYDDEEDLLRCKKCRGRDRDGDGDTLRCGRCGGRGRADDDDDMTRGDSKNGERCQGNRCGRGRADDRRDDDWRDDDSRDDDGRDDDRRDDERRDDDGRDVDRRDDDRRDDDRRDDDRRDDDRSELRCKGDRCGEDRSRNDDDIDTAFKSVLDNYGKRYKINNELDAIVLDVDNLDDVLESLSPNDKKSDDDRNLIFISNEQNRLDKNRQRELSFKQQDKRNKPWTLQSLGDENLLVLKEPLELGQQSKVRSLLPMTLKQKKRRAKLHSGIGPKEKVQVPFMLEVQGLGQANVKPY